MKSNSAVYSRIFAVMAEAASISESINISLMCLSFLYAISVYLHEEMLSRQMLHVFSQLIFRVIISFGKVNVVHSTPKI